MTDFPALIITLIFVVPIAWGMGWHFGARSLRNRNRNLIKALESYANNRDNWNPDNEETPYRRGFASGVSSTLNALHNFLARFEEESEDGTA